MPNLDLSTPSSFKSFPGVPVQPLYLKPRLINIYSKLRLIKPFFIPNPGLSNPSLFQTQAYQTPLYSKPRLIKPFFIPNPGLSNPSLFQTQAYQTPLYSKLRLIKPFFIPNPDFLNLSLFQT